MSPAYKDMMDLVDSGGPGILISNYLCHCYIYYIIGESVITDREFDSLAKTICENWGSIDHIHKQLIDFEALQYGGSGYYIKYPTIVKGAAESLIKKYATNKP